MHRQIKIAFFVTSCVCFKYAASMVSTDTLRYRLLPIATIYFLYPPPPPASSHTSSLLLICFCVVVAVVVVVVGVIFSVCAFYLHFSPAIFAFCRLMIF